MTDIKKLHSTCKLEKNQFIVCELLIELNYERARGSIRRQFFFWYRKYWGFISLLNTLSINGSAVAVSLIVIE